MTNSNSTPHEVSGAKIIRVEPSEALHWIEWVRGTEPMPTKGDSPDELRWLLAHCTEGVTWGRRAGDGTKWQLGSSAFGDHSPHISLVNLLELRLFGEHGELLLWRDGQDPPSFRGRWLIDDPNDSTQQVDNPRRPHDETRILVGNKPLGSNGGFTRVGDGTGREQAVPLDCLDTDFGSKQRPTMPLRLSIRHYFETNDETGAVRVAASRLVEVFNAASHGDR